MRNFAAAMRSKTLIFLFLAAVMFVMAGTSMPFFSIQKRGVGVNDTIADAVATAADTSVTAALAALRDSSDVAMTADSLSATAAIDTTKLDSLQLAIYHHNKQIDDSIRLDSINRRRSNGINSPVVYSADDSLVYVATSRRAHLYGNSTVKYENMNLKSLESLENILAISIDVRYLRVLANPKSTIDARTEVFSELSINLLMDFLCALVSIDGNLGVVSQSRDRECSGNGKCYEYSFHIVQMNFNSLIF